MRPYTVPWRCWFADEKEPIPHGFDGNGTPTPYGLTFGPMLANRQAIANRVPSVMVAAMSEARPQQTFGSWHHASCFAQ